MPARVWELQSRGVLHAHVVVPYGSGVERAAADLYVSELHALAGHYGFGFVDRKLASMSAKGAAAYLSAYFVSGRKAKAQLHESVMSPDMPRSIVHVSNRLTQHTGVTMRELRFRRYVWFIADRTGCDLEEARTIAILAKAGELDLTVDCFSPSARFLAQVLGCTPPPDSAQRLA